MQLDELKILWHADPDSDPEFDRSQLRDMLNKRSQTAMGKIRRNVWSEIILLVAFAVLVLGWFALRDMPVHWAEWLLFVLLFPTNGLLYWYKVKTFVRSDYSQDLAHSLDTYIQKLDHYLSLYKSFMVYVVPVLGTIGIFYGFTLARLENGKGYEDLPWQIYPILAVVTVVYGFLAVKFTAWYMKKLYGNHLDELKSVQSELKETLPENSLE